LLFGVRHLALEQVSVARQRAPSLLAEVRSEARQAVRTARTESRRCLFAVHERAALDARQSRDVVERALAEVATGAKRVLVDGSTRAEAMMREIAGQGPEKSLGRGFAIVHAADGSTVTSAESTPSGASIEIQFRDGRVAARTDDDRRSEPT
jgi:exodeoxyribonuclease VII large subunit